MAEAVPLYEDNRSKLSRTKFYGAGKSNCNVPTRVRRVMRLKFISFSTKRYLYPTNTVIRPTTEQCDHATAVMCDRVIT